jgi:hypothetical protein
MSPDRNASKSLRTVVAASVVAVIVSPNSLSVARCQLTS